MRFTPRDAGGPVVTALVRRLGGKVTLGEQELEDAGMFNVVCNAYDDQLTVSLSLPNWPEYEDERRKLERTHGP